jgi:c-di-AMP phosphodiesterase-like protein
MTTEIKKQLEDAAELLREQIRKSAMQFIASTDLIPGITIDIKQFETNCGVGTTITVQVNVGL